MLILFISLAEIDDRTWGGAIRSNDMRAALLEAGTVHTLVIHGAHDFALDGEWSEHGVKRATINRNGWSPAALLQRRRVRRWVAQCIGEQPYDVIVARYIGTALFVPWRAWRKLIVDADDIVKSNPGEASLAKRAKLWVRNAIAARLVRRSRHVWFVNPGDFRRSRIRSKSLVRNTVRLPDVVAHEPSAGDGRILMVGCFTHPPNAEALEWFADRVLPGLLQRFPAIELHAIGRIGPDFDRRFRSPVRIRGFVADLDAEYARASLVVAPIHAGGGTQIKVIEALAHGRPLVASTFAHSGFAETLRPDVELLVASEAQEWIEKCNWALQQPVLANEMGRRGRQAVQRSYGFERMVTDIGRSLQQLSPTAAEGA
jgi:glycosyltransferase involved in cell wall biosynthesis